METLNKKDRIEAIQNLVASIAVLTWSRDLEMSHAIMDTTAKKFGLSHTEEIMSEVANMLSVLQFGGNFDIDKDLINYGAALAFVRPLPLNWSSTIN